MITLKELQFSELEVADPNAEYSGTQTIFLDFDGASGVSYDNDTLGIYTNIPSISDSGLSQEDQFQILTDLNSTYAGTGITFTITAPLSGEYSTIYIGGDGAELSEYGSFAGISETIDIGNEIKDDEAFVFSENLSSIDVITETIAHEAAHLVGYTHVGDTAIDELSDFATVATLPLGTTKFTATDGSAYDRFGANVAVSGTTVIVGSPFDDNDAVTIEDVGSVYVYRWNGVNAYNDAIKIEASDAAEDWFGFSVDAYGDAIIVGAAYGDIIVDEAVEVYDTGAAYLYTWNGGTYGDGYKITATDAEIADPAENDFFGGSVAISGEAIVIGARGDDNAKGTNAGSVYVYHWDGDSYEYQSKVIAEDGGENDAFGHVVDVSGYNIAVGTYDNTVDATGAYVYRWNSLTSTYAEHKLTIPGDAVCYSYGNSIAISGDVVAVGARCEDGGNGVYSGNVYVYRWDDVDTYSEVGIFKASEGTNYEFFGQSLAIDGDNIVVGAYGDSDNGVGAGAIYVYHWNDVSESYDEYKITSEDGNALDFFGQSISIDGDYIVVGADGDGYLGYKAGSAYSINFADIIAYSDGPNVPPNDFDGNNKSDILWLKSDASVYTWDNGGSSWNSLGSSTGYTFLDTGDFSGNGQSDIIWQKDNKVYSWNDGAPSVGGDGFGDPVWDDISGYTFLGTGDFGGDGLSDILWQYSDGNVYTWDDGVVSRIDETIDYTAYTFLGIGHYDDNNRSEVLWQHSDGNVYIWNDGTLGDSIGDAPDVYTFLGNGDFDGNGQSDILWQDPDGYVHSWDDGNSANERILGLANFNYSFLDIGDFDGNRKSDILWQDTAGNVFIWDDGELGTGWADSIGYASSDYSVLSSIA